MNRSVDKVIVEVKNSNSVEFSVYERLANNQIGYSYHGDYTWIIDRL